MGWLDPAGSCNKRLSERNFGKKGYFRRWSDAAKKDSIGLERRTIITLAGLPSDWFEPEDTEVFKILTLLDEVAHRLHVSFGVTLRPEIKGKVIARAHWKFAAEVVVQPL